MSGRRDPYSIARTMEKPASARHSSTTRALGILNAVGDVLVLQLSFAVASIGIVTILPAAIALQRGLDEVLIGGESASIRRFAVRTWREFLTYWRLSIAVPALALMLVVGTFFWAAAADPMRLIALAFLLPIAGLALGLYVSGLATFISSPDRTSERARVALAWQRLRKQPLSVAACVVVMVTWFLLMSRLPTMGLIGSGIVPAFLAVWLLRGRLSRLRAEAE